MPDQPLTPQMNVRVDPDIKAKAIVLARIRNERDFTGKGASVVVRRALARYVKQHEDQLPDNWRDLL